MRKLLLLLVVGALMMVASPCRADIPRLINYQGMLTDNAGNPLSGPRDLTFTIYNAPASGTAFWTEAHTAVPIDNGLFNVVLGKTNPVPDSVFNAPERFLGIKVGTDPELAPRIELTSVGYAYRALAADSHGGWVDDGAVVRLQTLTDKVGIGTSTPGAQLEVYSPDEVDLCLNRGGKSWAAVLDFKRGGSHDWSILTPSGDTSLLILNQYHHTVQSFLQNGNVGIGTAVPSERLDVSGTVKMSGFKMATGAVNGHVLTSDGSGGGTWKAPSGSGSHWSVTDSVLFTNNLWGIARGGAGNAISGYQPYTQVNLGVNCTTSVFGQSGYPSYATISGGEANYTGDSYATIGGGWKNRATNDYTTVGGGENNSASGAFAAVAGGRVNQATGYSATISGGEGNESTGSRATVGGGQINKAYGNHATVGGGYSNEAPGDGATVPGGYDNTAQGNFSFAAGRKARANHGGCFVWADSTDGDFTSTGTNQFLIRASGGVGIGTNSPDRILHIVGDNPRILIEASSISPEVNFKNSGDSNSEIWSLYKHGTTDDFRFYQNGDRVTIESGTGYVGIGTTDPGYRLDVNGDINVSGNIRKGGTAYTHPDYVFEPDYELMSLEDLKEYVSEKKCLPNVISAEDVKRNNGYNMDQLLIQMLEKIEEQTLYIFQLEERIAELERRQR